MTRTKNNLIAALILVAGMALYDNLVKVLDSSYDTMLATSYNAAILGYILFRIIKDAKKSFSKIDQYAFYVLGCVFGLRVFLNVIAFFGTWKQYHAITSNYYIDLVTWVLLILALIIILCRENQILQRIFSRLS